MKKTNLSCAIALLLVAVLSVGILAGCVSNPADSTVTDPTEGTTPHEHIAAADDGDCTTAVICSVDGCDYVITEAKAHVAGADDGNCETAVKCENCKQNAIEAKSHTGKDDGDVATAVVCENEGCEHIIVEAKEAITLTIPTLANGKIVTDKTSYAIGDTVVLGILPDEGYAQKLYINGEPVLLNWKNNAYTFVAEQSSYVISGDFVQSLSLTALDVARWDDANHAHGILNTYYPSNVDSWWININGEYKAFEITAKNYLPVEDSKDDGANGVDGYQQMIRMELSNGKTYAFRIYNDKGTYAVSCTAQSGSVTGWTNWKKIDDAAAAAMNADGVQFKLERTAANTLTVSVNGTVWITYTMDGVTEADKVVSVGVLSFYNQGKYVDIPFELTPVA